MSELPKVRRVGRQVELELAALAFAASCRAIETFGVHIGAKDATVITGIEGDALLVDELERDGRRQKLIEQRDQLSRIRALAEARSAPKPHQGARERARRRRQIAEGTLRVDDERR